jgi:hypothetical protein
VTVEILLKGNNPSGLVALVDDEDAALVTQYTWCPHKDRETVYVRSSVYLGHGKYRHTLMHRLLMGTPVGYEVDHKDRNGLNNRRSNLRVATKAQNQGNRRCNRTSKTGLKGVHVRENGRFQARITGDDGRLHGLGTYDSAEEAACVYDAAAREKYGEFALCNFPDSLMGMGSGEW